MIDVLTFFKIGLNVSKVCFKARFFSFGYGGVGKEYNNLLWGFPGGAGGKEPACQSRRGVRDADSGPGSGRSLEEGMADHFSILTWRIPWTITYHRLVLKLPALGLPWWSSG